MTKTMKTILIENITFSHILNTENCNKVSQLFMVIVLGMAYPIILAELDR